MEIILARHGEPVVEERHDAPADPGLTRRGAWQARRLGDWLACEPIDWVITSSMRRAQQTALPLQAHLGLASEVVKDFDEIDRRSRVYAPFHVLKERFPAQWEAIQRQDWEFLGWDPPEVFNERVIAAWEGLLARRPGERVFVACHGGVIGAIAAHLLGTQMYQGLANAPFASMTRIRAHSDGRVHLVSVNEIGHFDASRDRHVGPDGEGFAAHE